MAPLKLLLTTFTSFLFCSLMIETKAQSFVSPCPRLFTYDTTTNETDRWYGTLTLVSESDLLDVWLRLTFDRVSLQLGNWFGQVETSDSKEYHIKKTNYELKANVPQKFKFFLKYNPVEPAPRLLSFRLNGKLVCPGDAFPNKVNTQLDTNNRDTVNVQSNINSQDRFNTNLQNGLNTPLGTSSRDKLDSQLNTNAQVFDTNIRDRVNPQPDINTHRVDTQFDVGSRDGIINPHVATQLSTNPRDKVNPQVMSNFQNTVGTDYRDKVNTQLDSNSHVGLGTQSNTNSRDRITQLDTNFHGGVSTQPSTNSRNKNSQLDSNFHGGVSTQPSTNSRDRINPQFVTNAQNVLGTNNQDRVNGASTNSRVGADTNSRDRVNTQPNSNSRDRPSIPLASSSSSRDTPNTQLGTNSRDTTAQKNVIHDDICGTVLPQPRPLIAYGDITHEGEFPWHSALYLAKRTMLTYICGASLISRNFVITAAHCVIKKKAQESFKPEELIIQLGKYNLKRFSVGYQDRLVSKIISHPQFNAETYLNDIALLQLTTPANITEYVRPVCLWQESVDVSAVLNKIGKVVGWGYDEAGKISEELMQAKMPVVPKDRCISSYPDFYTRFTSPNSYCAGFANGTSPCNGDAGGGMVFPIPNSNRRNPVWQIRGLISILPAFQNQMLCDVTHYTIFTDVAKYLDWIAASMK